MSVAAISDNKLRLNCDGPSCSNHFVLDNTTESQKEASDWLIRRGWRTIEARLHYCRFCSVRMECFQSDVTEAEQQTRLRAGRSGRYNQI